MLPWSANLCHQDVWSARAVSFSAYDQIWEGEVWVMKSWGCHAGAFMPILWREPSPRCKLSSSIGAEEGWSSPLGIRGDGQGRTSTAVRRLSAAISQTKRPQTGYKAPGCARPTPPDPPFARWGKEALAAQQNAVSTGAQNTKVNPNFSSPQPRRPGRMKRPCPVSNRTSTERTITLRRMVESTWLASTVSVGVAQIPIPIRQSLPGRHEATHRSIALPKSIALRWPVIHNILGADFS